MTNDNKPPARTIFKKNYLDGKLQSCLMYGAECF